MIEDVIVDLYWSNKDGWVDRPSADVFSDSEKETLNLPYGGRWVSVQEVHERRIESMNNHPSSAWPPRGAGLTIVETSEELDD
jgi:hypothetical protein